MSDARQGRAKWLLAGGLAVAILAIIWLASGSRSEDANTAPPATGSEPAPVPTELPAPPQARVEPAAESAAPLPAATEVAAQPKAAAPSADAAPAKALLRVLVLDSAGKPLEWAEVTTLQGTPPATRTGDDGLALIEAQPGAAVAVAARHPDYRLASGSATLGEAGSSTDLTLRLTEGLTVCLEVQARDGRPIEDARLRFKEVEVDSIDGERIGPDDYLQVWETSNHIRGRFEERRKTDAAGRCCLKGVASGHLAVSVAADGYVPVIGHNLSVDADGGDLGVIVLEPAVKATGFVTDAAGAVPEVLVEALVGIRFHRLPDDGEEDYDEAYQRSSTDANGRFEFDGIPGLPATGSLLASHPVRGRSYMRRVTWTEQPLQVTLVPDVVVRFELNDAQTKQAIEGEVELDADVPQGEFLLLAQARGYGFGTTPPRSARLEAGRLTVQMPYYLESLTLRVPGYDAAAVPMTTMAADADGVMALELTRPSRLLVRVRAAGSGELIQEARLSVGQFDVVKGREMQMRYFLLQGARFDAEVGGYVVAESDLGYAGHARVALFAEAKGFAGPSEPVTVALDGQRSSPAEVDLFLKRE